MDESSSPRRKPLGLRKKGFFVISLIVVVAAVLVVKGQKQGLQPSTNGPERLSARSDGKGQLTAENPISPERLQPAVLPRLVDLGADKCVPCKMMVPILEELREEYRGRFDVEFIDVWKKPETGRQWRIRVIPTQIFIDGNGKELYRHEGFFSKEDILKKWKELGVDIEWRVGLRKEQKSEIKPASMGACCGKPKARIPGWSNFRP